MKFNRLLTVAGAAMLTVASAGAQKHTDRFITDMMQNMSPDEKIEILCNTAPSIPRLGLPQYDWWSEALHGVARNGKATVFPKPIALGGMWDPELMKEIADAIAVEGIAKYQLALREKGHSDRFEGITFFSPTLNIARDPRWGRFSECFSEDPLLLSEMGVAFIRGMQGDDPDNPKVLATAKHFVANNEENRRASGSADVDEVSLREYYFPAFRAAVEDGKVLSVMGAYNALNGVPCCANKFLLTDVLRDEWGFDGVVMSDGSAVGKISDAHKYTDTFEAGAAAALLAGCDMSLRDEYRSGLRKALAENLISIDDIDRSLYRVLEMRKRLGLIDGFDKKRPQYPMSVVECDAHKALAYRAACESATLLKNDSLLPLDASVLKKVVLVGEAFKHVYYGDYAGQSEQQTTLYDALADRYADTMDITWFSDAKKEETVPEDCLTREKEYEYDGIRGFTGYYFNSTSANGEPVLNRHDLTIDLKPKDIDSINGFKALSARWISSVRPNKTGRYHIVMEGAGNKRMTIGGDHTAQAAGNSPATMDIELTAGKNYAIRIECDNMKQDSHYRLKWTLPSEGANSELETKAKEADAVVVFVRETAGSEERDRLSLQMDADQIDLIKQLASFNKNIIVILGNSAPVMVTDIIPASRSIINIWIGGQGEADAVADILFGKVNPSGKISVTMFADQNQLPPIDDYNVSNGRSYQYFNGDVVYPFGYGLSYTDYTYSAPRLKKVTSDGITVSVKVRNNGHMDGDEIIQCYAASDTWKEQGQKKRLVGFKRVSIKKGKTENVELFIPRDHFEKWNTDSQRWEVYPGNYTLSLVPNSAATNDISVSIDK